MSAFNGSGTFVISGTGLPYVTATTISSTVANQLNTDLATGLSTTVTKDGQTTPTANLPMGTFKHTGAGNATASGQYLVYAQPQVNIFGAAAAAFGTTGTGLIGNAFTQTDSTTVAGTVATAYGSVFGAFTLATAANAITVTNGYGAYFAAPVAGSHVTLTNGWALGADSALINGALKATGTITPSSTNGIVGTTTNDSANAGSIGELLSATAAGVSLSTATAKTITSVSLTAGDWDVWLNVKLAPVAATTVNRIFCSISQTNNTLDTTAFDLNTEWGFLGATPGSEFNPSFSVGPTRISLSGTTIIYGVGQVTFGGSTLTVGAKVNARRRR